MVSALSPLSPARLAYVVTTADLRSRIEQALRGVKHPRTGADVLTLGLIQDLQVDAAAGAVAYVFRLGADDPGALAREARKAVHGVAGVTSVQARVQDAATAGGAERARPGTPGGPAVPPPPTADELPQLGKTLAVSSGKGGVGKSTVAANLATALAAAGHRVGLMDADIYGPNIPRMMGVFDKPAVRGGKMQPLEAHGVRLVSLGSIIERDAPAIWRGPIIMKVIQQFLHDVDWGELDYFLVDLPPGTGDAQLSLVQTVRLHGALIVTTPQEVAVGDSLRGAKMFERVNVPVVGIVENMSFFVCPHCNERSSIFLSGGGQRLADELGVPLLGQVPLQAGLADLADEGRPVVISAPDSPAARALDAIARRAADALAGLRPAAPIGA